MNGVAVHYLVGTRRASLYCWLRRSGIAQREGCHRGRERRPSGCYSGSI